MLHVLYWDSFLHSSLFSVHSETIQWFKCFIRYDCSSISIELRYPNVFVLLFFRNFFFHFSFIFSALRRSAAYRCIYFYWFGIDQHCFSTQIMVSSFKCKRSCAKPSKVFVFFLPRSWIEAKQKAIHNKRISAFRLPFKQYDYDK